MDLDSSDEGLDLVPRDVAGPTEIHFMDDIVVTFLAHLSSSLELVAHLLVELLEVGHEIISVELHLVLLVDGLVDLLHLSIDLFLSYSLDLQLLLLSLVNKIIELHHLTVSDDDLVLTRLKHELDTTNNRSLNLEVRIELEVLMVQVPESELLGS